MISKILWVVFLSVIAAITFTACTGSGPSPQTRNPKNSLAVNKTLLEASPFNIIFSASIGQADDTTSFIKGKSPDGTATATIQYNPSDQQFYWIEFTQQDLHLKPSRDEVRTLIDFSNNYDKGFSNYFDRNFDGIFFDEDKFIDNGRYVNKVKGYGFIMDGNIELNNKDIQAHPEQKDQILAIGNFASVTVVNINKPSWIFNHFENWKIVEH